jgi:hypothetical protein
MIAQVDDPFDHQDQSEAEKLNWACFKHEVYHKVLAVILGTVAHKLHLGDTICCGDLVTRVLHPGFAIVSVDGEEACAACACRAALALYPCPHCLVHKDSLDLLMQRFTLHSTKTMLEVYEQVVNAGTKTQVEEILKKNGLHQTQVCK